LWACLALLVFYVLSFGPAAVIADRTGWNEALLVAYAPVMFLHQNTSLRRPIESYVSFWNRLAGGKPVAPDDDV